MRDHALAMAEPPKEGRLSNASQGEFLRSRTTRANPAFFAGHLQVSGKSRGSKECVVADAVGIEPVSASQFPDNREIIREFCRIELGSGAFRP
jgi:hypothetical protein